MKVRVAAKAGFCFGVKRAIEIVKDTVRGNPGPIYTLGPLIHNPQVVASLAEMGVVEIDNLKEISNGTIVIRSHGVSPEIVNEARVLGLDIVDATCTFVRRAQELAHDLTEQGYQVVVVGDRDHPEVQGIKGWTGGKAIVVENPAEAALLNKEAAYGVIAQTTQPLENFNSVVEVLRGTGAKIKVCNTICNATSQRQQAARELAGKVGMMVVVGGANSANTRKLAGLCAASGTATHLIETADELDPAWFNGVNTAGLTAGASTPDWIIEEVRRRMSEIEEQNGPEQEEEMKDAVEVKAVRPGDIVTGTVVHVGQDEVMVDVGAKSEGIIPIRELSCCDVTSPQDIVKVGDEIEVYVLKAEDNEGKLILSKEKADAEKAWEKLEEILNSGEPVEGVVRDVVKGGLLVDVGVRAFLPASLVERGYVEDLSKYLNQTITARVIELNRGRKKVILSRKAVLEEEYARIRQEMLDNLEEGQVVKGVVRRLTQFGSFVDIGGVDGLLHISEMSWHRINHPSEVVKVGDEIEVKVLRIDRDNEKISLGLKQVLPNPWDTVEQKYAVGGVVKAKVVRLAPFGAFVQLEPGVEGLVHISHLADRHVAKPDEVVSEGEEVNVKVLSVDPAEKRIRLSIREVAKEKQEREVRDFNNTKTQEKNDVVTIGDMVGDLFEKKDIE
ncbi:bifunctional 4-hydroxy-3-methylbut-2-enyl diphosphate reductase/30S ribosomal protein S1 [Pelotomaculum propionicicum]|uniref:4-hydroxy-3-methylbut-2-enyl diphosphate reductase n=1 Tax=Pelotomaculum propionicicum TaxID=258475 RepID=A0A4Y7RSE3_9FIRM|nr:bifunctional 4-hydroxy-3-methylbut-2-enyl diphosphate reductase/30S ribosomal protein S1 [Pelotomaculum propionicicum]NLI11903.1 bifunctional 4-hydroxy-3-methylbut-2-enyl diphosphate reductase/30S ribosomal protein S1 [Peptococcaceae bacterium]TEB11803.1 30S ribosomal protein S1 [Pelotomaculum propionicicum]